MTALTVGELQQRVDRGVEWLDANIPDWWKADRPNRGGPWSNGGPIDLDELSMQHPCYCVLGHLLGNYYRAEIATDDAVACGFDTAAGAALAEPFSDDEADGIEAAMRGEFEALTELWARTIEARRAAVPPDRL